MSACKGPLLVSEKLALQQILRDCRAVDGHELFFRSAAHLVDGACDQFLACSGISVNDHVCIRGGGIQDEFIHLLHGRALADKAPQAISIFDRGAQADVLPPEMLCLFEHRQLSLLALSDVAGGHEHGGEALPLDQARSALNPDLSSRLCTAAGFEGSLFGKSLFDHVEHLPEVHFEFPGDEFPYILTEQISCIAIAEDGQDGVIREDDPRVLTEHGSHRHPLSQHTIEGLALTQGILGLFEFGQVDSHAQHIRCIFYFCAHGRKQVGALLPVLVRQPSLHRHFPF